MYGHPLGCGWQVLFGILAQGRQGDLAIFAFFSSDISIRIVDNRNLSPDFIAAFMSSVNSSMIMIHLF